MTATRLFTTLFLAVTLLTAAASTKEWNSRAGFEPWPVDPNSGLPVAEGSQIVSPLAADTSDFSLRLILKIETPARHHSSFTILLVDSAGFQRKISLTEQTGGIPEIAERKILRLSMTDDAGHIYSTDDYKCDIDNFSIITLSRNNGVLTIHGEKHKHSFGKYPYDISGIGIAAPQECKITIHSGRWTHRPPLSRTLTSSYDISDIDRLLDNTHDVIAGHYAIYSSALDNTRLGMGGDYRLAILPDDAEGYFVLYLDGAVTNASAWQPGMVKAHLTPTFYNGVYDVKWYDADGNPLQSGVKATVADDSTLRLIFPYQSSELTLRRISR